MKKIMLVLVLGFLWSGNAYSQVIEYNKCRSDEKGVFNKTKFEEFKFIINTNLKTVTNVIIYTDDYVKEEREELMKIADARFLDLVKKIRITKALITYLDNEYIKANYTSGGFDNSYTINKKKKTILSEGEGEAINIRSTVFCQ
jgi:hypothetical protein